MTTSEQTSIRPQEAAKAQGLTAAIARADSRQQRAEERNAILDGAVAITTEVLARGRLALAGPVVAKFQTGDHGSTGVELIVWLKDPSRAAAAKKLITERFGGECRSDTLTIR